MTVFQKAIFIVLLTFFGCQDKSAIETPVSGTEQKEPLVLAAQRLTLPTITAALTWQHKRLDPVVTDRFILCFEENNLLILDKQSNQLKKTLYGFTVQTAPLVQRDTLILVTQEHGLIRLSLSTFEILDQKKLQASLLAQPLLLDNKQVFVQYVHNVAELLTQHFDSVWKVSVPSISSYQKLSSYHPCADQDAIYLAAPGTGLLALDRKTGLVRWNYRAFVEFNAASFADKQVSNPLAFFEDVLVAKVSDGTIHLVDKETGIGLELIASNPASPIVFDDKHAYFTDPEGAIVCYDLLQRELVWKNNLFEGLPVISMRLHGDRLFFNGSLPHLYTLNVENGNLEQHFVHQFREVRLLWAQENDVYGIDNAGVFFNLFPERLA